MSVQILQGDCRELLKTLPEKSVHCCVTSPPYWGLRNYGVEGQLGLEKTPEEYVEKMVEVFKEVKRVLRDDGTLWLNLGDSYWGSGNASGHTENTKNLGKKTSSYGATKGHSCQKHDIFKPKDLCGIPWRVAFALQADGWWLRQDIIWAKKNVMPESIKDRCTKSHEYIFLLTKSAKYYYDYEAIKEPSTFHSVDWNADGTPKRKSHVRGEFGGKGSELKGKEPFRAISATRNKRDVWFISTKPYKGAHFATFPIDLVEPCILAGTSDEGCCSVCGTQRVRVTKRQDKGYDGSKYGERAVESTGGAISGGTAKSTLGSSGGRLTGKTFTIGWETGCKCQNAEIVPCTVLDPFNGAGTTGVVAEKHGRNYIGCELNPEYVELTNKRLTEKKPTKVAKKEILEVEESPKDDTGYIQTDLFNESLSVKNG